ncbi:MAG: tetrahydrofolate dehydrogenase/cyclohydrolase catalytic domain-containing protein [Vicingaceae bacterium]|jgi:methylenetetrahydrofolate dehydrogenase (NADP+)/methenyltetrahydrofolate cyclohydrolase|nr:bifunctional 5,10-methylene-tetrahydrofolate dehydrogenase/5,10-methylene-tetrahydrofolate cyclohydrolase [Flavobacteriales bacterium]MBQ19662.1 bifunctional 5,10-methylene-tetrahydrofolate dehydrogenase/5,10-methylene-tetrahydrofolate cyclohydrolase [Flavobacteriales bacterium]MDF1676862.1 tetrahydrofolate dehydrogenase/cyclohydrolase catalytic domain-containing protein [Vicingaceae bacterium]|tara:strand:- start:235912 stop:236790 length:879 start_codon:yes stop_codon:yes gene_type:complete
MPTIISGKEVADKIKLEIAEEVSKLKDETGRTPHLAAILVGNDGASKTYVNAKVKACEVVGFRSTLVALEKDVTEEHLLNEIDKLNNDDDLDGFIVQLPLPEHINEQKITEAINPKKDVDGFHPTSLGKMLLGLPTFLPATPLGVTEMLKHHNIPTEGKHCVVIGRSHIVGSPMSVLMSQNTYPGNCTVTITHSRTQNLKEITLQADILIVALGKPEFVTTDMVKKGATVIDVGIHRIEDSSKKSGFRLIGDVKFDEVAPKCSYISPVPGGVGPMTIVSLLKNTLLAAKNKK